MKNRARKIKRPVKGRVAAVPVVMETHISEGSGGLSGGQRQRLTIARAIVPKPSILMFDEATSALDNPSQKQVPESLAKLPGRVEEVDLAEAGIAPLDNAALEARAALADAGHFDAPALRWAREFAAADEIVVAAPYWTWPFPPA